MMKTSIVTGAFGQDASYLCELLLDKGYRVVGVSRRSSRENNNMDNCRGNKNYIAETMDITDVSGVRSLIKKYRPDEFYNLAALSVHPDTYVNIIRFGSNKRQEVIHISKVWDRFSRFHDIRIESCVCEDGSLVDVEVIDLPNNDNVKILGYRSGMGEWFALKQLSRHKYKGKLIKLRQKWGEICVTPNHSVYNDRGDLVKPTSNPTLLGMRKINYYNKGQKDSFELPIPAGIPIEKNNGFFSLKIDGMSHSRVNFRYMFSEKDGSLPALMRVFGAFLSEGSCVVNSEKGIYRISLYNNDKKWLESLSKDLSILTNAKVNVCKPPSSENCYRLEFSSKIMAYWFKQYCGRYDKDRTIPNFVFNLSKEMILELLKTLWFGDGSIEKTKKEIKYRIGLTSDKLIAQLCTLYTMLGIDYIYSFDDRSNLENHNDSYQVREVLSYGSNGNKYYSEIDYDGYVYDLEVDEVHNFCAGFGNIVVHNTHVGTSFKEPLSTLMVNSYGVVGILEAIRHEFPSCKFLQAGTSEQFGSNYSTNSYLDHNGKACYRKTQDENTPFSANSPYAASKIYAFNMTSLYRRSYDLFCCNSICFNHESVRRPKDFVTRKLSLAAVNIKYGYQDKIKMGNLDPKRDIGHSKDYVRAMWMMLQHHRADDYVISTNESLSVRKMGQFIFQLAGLNFMDYYVPDPKFMRPCEVEFLNGDSGKIRSILNWKPEFSWKDVLSEMYHHDERKHEEEYMFN